MNEQETSNNEKYVLYADIMGFKERVMRTKHTDLKKELKKLRQELEEKLSPFVEKTPRFKVLFFSDSILVSDEISDSGFYRISQAAVGLMQISLKHKFPINGAIAKGEFTDEISDGFFFGRAIVDAYLLQLDVHYYGIVAHHTMEEDIKEYSNGDINVVTNRIWGNPYVLSPTPLKSGNITHYHLAYNLINSELKIEKDIKETNTEIISWLEEISGTVSGSPRIYVDNTLRVLEQDLNIYKKTRKKTKQGEVEFPLKAFR